MVAFSIFFVPVLLQPLSALTLVDSLTIDKCFLSPDARIATVGLSDPVFGNMLT